jgi:NADPH-dependent 7-cyano-7-deazaguanine reductase QueF
VRQPTCFFKFIYLLTFRYMNIKTDPLVLQIGADLKNQFNIEDILVKVTGLKIGNANILPSVES